MKLKMYCIYDSAAGAYMRPFFVQTDSVATRAFSDLVMDAQHEIGKHPEHYSLFRVGEFDDNNASKSYFEDPECVATAMEMVGQAQKVDKDKLVQFDEKLAEAN